MADKDSPLPLRCPRCGHDQSTLTISARTVLTVACAKCRHSWETEVDGLPANVRYAAIEAHQARNT